MAAVARAERVPRREFAPGVRWWERLAVWSRARRAAARVRSEEFSRGELEAAAADLTLLGLLREAGGLPDGERRIWEVAAYVVRHLPPSSPRWLAQLAGRLPSFCPERAFLNLFCGVLAAKCYECCGALECGLAWAPLTDLYFAAADRGLCPDRLADAAAAALLRVAVPAPGPVQPLRVFYRPCTQDAPRWAAFALKVLGRLAASDAVALQVEGPLEGREALVEQNAAALRRRAEGPARRNALRRAALRPLIRRAPPDLVAHIWTFIE